MRRYDNRDVQTLRNTIQTVLTGRRREKKMAAEQVSPRVVRRRTTLYRENVVQRHRFRRTGIFVLRREQDAR